MGWVNDLNIADYSLIIGGFFAPLVVFITKRAKKGRQYHCCPVKKLAGRKEA